MAPRKGVNQHRWMRLPSSKQRDAINGLKDYYRGESSRHILDYRMHDSTQIHVCDHCGAVRYTDLIGRLGGKHLVLFSTALGTVARYNMPYCHRS